MKTILIITCSFIVVFSTAYSTDLNVPGDFPTIQAAFNAASSGDRIIIAAGTYTGQQNAEINFQGKSIEMIGQGSSSTIIDGQNSHNGFYFQNNTVNNSRVADLTIKNCIDDYVGGIGLWNGASVTIENCRIENCACHATGSEGGGIRVHSSSAILNNVTISGCEATYGGGINVLDSATLTIRNSLIENCFGGGIYIAQDCTVNIDDCMVRYNLSSSESYVGGVSVYRQSTMSMKKCWIMCNHNNHSGGGGIHIENGSYSNITNCIIAGNTAAIAGGAFLFRNNASADILHCTIADNDSTADDDAIYIENSTPKFKNDIIWNESTSMEFNPPWTAQGNVIYCDVRGGVPGIGNIQLDPNFLGNNSYHISKESPCIDVGISAGVNEDIDSEPRPAGSGFDMGADEYLSSPIITVDLTMPAAMYHSGDTFWLNMTITNTGDTASGIPVFCLLNVASAYYFWPDWDDFSYQSHNIPGSDSLNIEILPSFTWPSNVGSASGIQFLGACTNVTMTQLLGTMDTITFGWSE